MVAPTSVASSNGKTLRNLRISPEATPRRVPLGIAFLAVAAGVTASRCGLPFPFLVADTVAGSALFLISIGRSWNRSAVFGLLFTLAGLGALWHHEWWFLFEANHVSRWAGVEASPVAVRVQFQEAPRIADNNRTGNTGTVERVSRCLVRAESIRDGNDWRRVTGSALLRVAGDLIGVSPGDRCEILATLQAPGAAGNPSDRSPLAYLRPKRQLFLLQAEHVQAVTLYQHASAWNPRWWIPRMRQFCAGELEHFAPARHRDLAMALLLGIRDNLDRELVDTFLVTGTVHLLSISGLHVGILAIAIAWTAAWLTSNERLSAVITMAVTVGYAMLAGGGAPVVRAAILVVVFGMAALFRQPRMSLNSLAAAGLVVLAINPTQLFDVGAQLSFLAVATIALANTHVPGSGERDPLDRLLQSKESAWVGTLRVLGMRVRRGFLIGTLIWIVSLPLVICHFHVVSLIAGILNLLLGLPFAVAMVAGFTILLVGWPLPPLAYLAGWTMGLSLDLVVGCARLGERFFLSHLWVAGPPLAVVGMFYLILSIALLLQFQRRGWIAVLGSAYLMMTVGWVYTDSFARSTPSEHRSLECRILAVGHGGCAVVDLPSGEQLMYDAGGMGNPRSIADSISRSLWFDRVSSIDNLILSHSDWDHCSAVPILSQRFPIRSVWLPPSMWQHPEENIQVLCRDLAAAAQQIRCVTTGDRIQTTPQAKVRVLYPDARRQYPNDNASSVVLLVESSGHRILFTGDLEHEGVRRLTSEPPLDVDILMAPHHGSLDSGPEQICAWCTPEWVIVSGNLTSSHGALQNYRNCGAKVLHTAIHGSIFIRFAKQGIQVTTGE